MLSAMIQHKHGTHNGALQCLELIMFLNASLQ